MTREVLPFHHLVGGLFDLRLYLRVHRAGGFIQDEYAGVEGQGPGKRKELALPDREGCAPFAQGLIVSLGEKLNDPVGTDPSCGGLDLGVADFGRAQPNVVGHVPAEEKNVLEDETDAASQLFQRRLLDRNAVQEDDPPLRVRRTS